MSVNLKELEEKGYLDIQINSELDLIAEIEKLKKEKNAVILGHYYQRPEIQDVSDFIGDSLALAQEAAKTKADMIVFAGVHFMAETAKILSPEKKVVLPDLKAGCSLADSCPADSFEQFIKKHPNHTVISYVNTTAELKTLTDIVCTSSNAKQIVENLPKDEKIIFAPDKNLGNYIKNITGREDMVIWDGACHVHQEFSVERILALKKEYPNSKILAHPECNNAVQLVADYIGSTSNMLKYSIEDETMEYIVATETGILHQMRKAKPEKTFIAAPPEDATCACSDCNFMKLNTLKKLYICMKYELPEILLSEEVINKAVKPIHRMLEISEKLGL